MEIEEPNIEPIRPRKIQNLILFSRSKALKKFISTVFRTINRYRSKIFQTCQKTIKLQFLIKTLAKHINPLIQLQVGFWYLKQNDPVSPELRLNDLFSVLSIVTSSLSLKLKSSCFHRLLYYKKNSFITAPEKNFLQIKEFYFKSVTKSLICLEKRMKNREVICKNRAYMKIIAYYKYLKSLSLYPARNSPHKSPQSSPSESPMRPSSSYSPNRYKLVPKFNRANPLYYPLYKMFAFIEQNAFMSVATSFKVWRLQVLLSGLS